MSRTATKLREEQLSLARKLKKVELGHALPDPLDLIRDGLTLAHLTLELDSRLCSGTPFPTAWILPALGRNSDPSSRSS